MAGIRERNRRKSLYERGVKSGLEDKVLTQLQKAGVDCVYEKEALPFVQPAENRKYTPDFFLTKKDGGTMIIETKGRFTVQDRKKIKLVNEQYPAMDFRMVFSYSKNKLYKGSKTTYGTWCDKINIPYADKEIPLDWLKECK